MEVVRSVRAPFADSERDCSTAYLATQLRQRGYITQQRNARPKECGKACGRTCLEKLQHTYILVTGSLDSAVTVRLNPDFQPPEPICFPRYGTILQCRKFYIPGGRQLEVTALQPDMTGAPLC